MDRSSLRPRLLYSTSLCLLLVASACSDSSDGKVPRAQPLAACAPESGCAGCSSCRELCLCAGQSESHCEQSCGPSGAGASGGAAGSGVSGASGAGTSGGGASSGGTSSGGANGGGCSEWWPTPECSGGRSGGPLGAGGQAGTTAGRGGAGGQIGGTGGQTSGGTAGTAGAGGAVGIGGGGMGTGGSTCTGSAFQANAAPPLVHLMVETSSRMAGAWASLRNGVAAFLQSPASAGVVVGFDSFPAGTECDGASYPGPFGVVPGAIPQGAQEIVSALNAITPAGVAPLEDALNGVLMLADAEYDPASSNAVALIVGGDPTSCSPSSTVLSQLAGNARSSSRPIRTYVLVISSAATSLLNGIASAGGSQQAQGSLLESVQISNALASVRSDLTSCSFAVPTTPEPVDWARINVQFRGGSPIPQVSSAAACSTQTAWYYDDPARPSRIELCPTACSSLKQEPNLRAEIVVGCPTVRAQ